MRVLVIEDDEGIAAGLRTHLAQQGCAVDLCGTLAEGWAALQAEPFDLLLLDLGLPDGDGSALLRRLRDAPAGRLPDAAGGPSARVADPHLPVLVMTARDAVASRIAALDLGADDYVTKPFDAGELAARMRALRRRAAGRGTPQLRLDGEVELDPSTRTARRAGAPVELSAREFDVLLALAEVRPRVLSRQQLEARLYDWDGGPDSNAIEVHVHRLRRKLGDGVIRTLRGVGYFVPAAGCGASARTAAAKARPWARRAKPPQPHLAGGSAGAGRARCWASCWPGPSAPSCWCGSALR